MYHLKFQEFDIFLMLFNCFFSSINCFEIEITGIQETHQKQPKH